MPPNPPLDIQISTLPIIACFHFSQLTIIDCLPTPRFSALPLHLPSFPLITFAISPIMGGLH